jgi:TonB family protein
MKRLLCVLKLAAFATAFFLFARTSPAQTAGGTDQTAPIQMGQPIHAVGPKLPKELRKKNVTAVLSGTISATGDFGELDVLNGDPAFTDIALDAVRQWRYSPPMQDGKAVDAKEYVVISADHGKVLSSVKPEVPVPTQPREPLKELFASERLFRLGATLKAPKVLNAPNPNYSELARRAKYQGVTALGVIVGPDGNPQDVWVVKKLGLALDRKAIDVVRTWKFEPATRDGEPVPVLINVEIMFRLY